MVEAGRSLIVEVTDGELGGYRGQLLQDLVKSAVARLAYAMAWDLAGTGVTALAISPGFLRSEAILEGLGVNQANWREAAKRRPEFGFSESPRYIGRVIAALAPAPDVAARSGASLWVSDLARAHGVSDADGSQPDFWGAIEAWLAPQIAAEADLPVQALWMAQARYAQIHSSPAHAQ